MTAKKDPHKKKKKYAGSYKVPVAMQLRTIRSIIKNKLALVLGRWLSDTL